jgi:hypothetical protein
MEVLSSTQAGANTVAGLVGWLAGWLVGWGYFADVLQGASCCSCSTQTKPVGVGL